MTSGAVDALTEPLDGRWPYRFRFRAREYVVAASGSWSFSEDGRGAYAQLPAQEQGRPSRLLKVHDRDEVEVLSYMGHWDYREVRVRA